MERRQHSVQRTATTASCSVTSVRHMRRAWASERRMSDSRRRTVVSATLRWSERRCSCAVVVMMMVVVRRRWSGLGGGVV
jgi:hypothetical protein